MSILEKLKDASIPSLYASGASLALYYFMIDSNISMKVPVGNMEVPIWAAIGGASFIGSEIGNLATEFIIPRIPVLKDFEIVEKTLVPAALSGLSSFLVMRTLISPDVVFKDSFIIGAGGQLIGSNLYNM